MANCQQSLLSPNLTFQTARKTEEVRANLKEGMQAFS
jgi:hypothetical protein